MFTKLPVPSCRKAGSFFIADISVANKKPSYRTVWQEGLNKPLIKESYP